MLDIANNMLSVVDTVTEIAKVATNGMIVKFRPKVTAVHEYVVICRS